MRRSATGLAGDLDQEASPARGLRAADPEDAGAGALATVDPGREPARDLGWEMTQQISRREVDPDTGLGFVWGIGDEEEGIVALHGGQVSVPAVEEGTVDGSPEAEILAGRLGATGWLVHVGITIAGRNGGLSIM